MSARFDAEAHRSKIEYLISYGYGCMALARALGISPITCGRVLDRLGIARPDKRSELRRWANQDPDFRARGAEHLRIRWNDPAFREAQRVGVGLRWRSGLSQELRALRRDLQRVGMEASEIRRQIDALRAQEAVA